MPLLLEIVTPDAKVYSETVDEVGLPTTEGRVHILPHHIPIIAKLDAGEILVRRGKEDEMLAVPDPELDLEAGGRLPEIELFTPAYLLPGEKPEIAHEFAETDADREQIEDRLEESRNDDEPEMSIDQEVTLKYLAGTAAGEGRNGKHPGN